MASCSRGGSVSARRRGPRTATALTTAAALLVVLSAGAGVQLAAAAAAPPPAAAASALSAASAPSSRSLPFVGSAWRLPGLPSSAGSLRSLQRRRPMTTPLTPEPPAAAPLHSTTAAASAAMNAAATTPAAAMAAGLGVLPSLGITELEIIKRLLTATFAGAAIGFERRYSERPAGLRTMALVSLGAAIFTILSLALPGDKSRMAASVASGVGFIGAGVISQNGFEDGKSGGRRIQQVNGLTTATAIWVSAALGVSSGAGLTLLTAIGAGLAVCVLRVGRFTRLIRLRRRDFQQSVSKLKALVDAGSGSPAQASAAAQFHQQQQQQQQGRQGPPPPPPPPTPVVVTSPNAAAAAAASAAGFGAFQARQGAGQGRQQQQQSQRQPRAQAAQDASSAEEEDAFIGRPLGRSAIALGVPPPAELFETTAPGGLGSQDIDFGDAAGGGASGSGGDMPMMISGSGEGGGGGEGGFGDGSLGGASGALSLGLDGA